MSKPDIPNLRTWPRNLSTAQGGGLSTSQYGGMSTSQYGGLSTSQYGGLSTSQYGGLSTSQYGGLSSSADGGMATSSSNVYQSNIPPVPLAGSIIAVNCKLKPKVLFGSNREKPHVNNFFSLFRRERTSIR